MGVAEVSFELRVANSVGFVVSGFRVIENPFSLLFLSADVLCWEQKALS